MEIAQTDAADVMMIVSGDTDLSPAVRAANSHFPDKMIGFLFPCKRKNAELSALSGLQFRMKRARYLQHQFPDPFTLPDGVKIAKPPAW